MIKIAVRHIRVEKLYPLAISRGVSTGSQNLFVFAEMGGFTGIGECAPGTGFDETLSGIAEEQIMGLCCNGVPGGSILKLGTRQKELKWTLPLWLH